MADKAWHGQLPLNSQVLCVALLDLKSLKSLSHSEENSMRRRGSQLLQLQFHECAHVR